MKTFAVWVGGRVIEIVKAVTWAAALDQAVKKWGGRAWVTEYEAGK